MYHKYFYVGASVPNFIKGDLYNKDQVDALAQSSQGSFTSASRTPHFFALAGGVIPAGKVLKIRPQIMYKYIASAEQKIPHEFDFNLSLLIYDRVNIGEPIELPFTTRRQD
ncbi:MAG: type IX secretion system membrane protein PorP/SprF [Chitinophagales bacterium]|nr:type IX secretion system membrane protein PorP/SprF [Chitinophagales bacterium]